MLPTIKSCAFLAVLFTQQLKLKESTLNACATQDLRQLSPIISDLTAFVQPTTACRRPLLMDQPAKYAAPLRISAQ